MTYIIIIAIIILFGIVSSKNEIEAPYSAEFGSASDHLSIFNYGYSLTGGLRATTRDVAYKNCLVTGRSGSGKTSTVLLGTVNTLSRGNAGMAIMDVSGEIYKLSSGYLATKKGYKIYCIDFGPNSDGFNPLALCKTTDDIQRVASVLIKNSNVESKGDKYWSTAGEMLISIFMQYVKFYTDPQFHSMANVLGLIESFAAEPQKVDKLFIHTNAALLKTYKGLVATPDRTLQSVISTATVALKIFKSPAVARCTGFNSIDFHNLRKEKAALYICIPLNLINFLAPVSALLFEILFQQMLSSIPEKNESDFFFLLDELVVMKFQNLGVVFSNCRKYRCGCLGLIQDEKMLEMNYSPAEAHAIKTNSFSKVFLQGQPLQTCQQLQEILGQRMHVDEKGIERRVHLMDASTIRMSKESIILLGSELPLKEKMYPYYDHFILNGRTKIPPFQSEKKIPFDEPPPLLID